MRCWRKGCNFHKETTSEWEFEKPPFNERADGRGYFIVKKTTSKFLCGICSDDDLAKAVANLENGDDIVHIRRNSYVTRWWIETIRDNH